MSIETSNIVAQGKDQVCAEVDGEVVMMSIQKGNYYGLDTVGGRIWELIAEPRQVSELCDSLASEYEVDRTILEADVLRFLNEMDEQGLIESRVA